MPNLLFLKWSLSILFSVKVPSFCFWPLQYLALTIIAFCPLFHRYMAPFYGGICRRLCLMFRFYSSVDSMDGYWFSRCSMMEGTHCYISPKFYLRHKRYERKPILFPFNAGSERTSCIRRLYGKTTLTSIILSFSLLRTVRSLIITSFLVQMQAYCIRLFIQFPIQTEIMTKCGPLLLLYINTTK